MRGKRAEIARFVISLDACKSADRPVADMGTFAPDAGRARCSHYADHSPLSFDSLGVLASSPESLLLGRPARAFDSESAVGMQDGRFHHVRFDCGKHGYWGHGVKFLLQEDQWVKVWILSKLLTSMQAL
jgi:hypothetical protein